MQRRDIFSLDKPYLPFPLKGPIGTEFHDSKVVVRGVKTVLRARKEDGVISGHHHSEDKILRLRISTLVMRSKIEHSIT